MNKVFIFALGAAAGSLVTWKIVEKKYKQIANEEIASVTKYYHNKLNKVETFDESIEKPEEVTLYSDGEKVIKMYDDGNVVFTDDEKEEYAEQVEELGYSEPIKEYIKPYVISPEDFGEYGNTTVSLTYYSDFTLATEDGEIVSDPEGVIGDALERFGEYEDDAIHVRDENIECDYEILKDERTFSEVYKGDN